MIHVRRLSISCMSILFCLAEAQRGMSQTKKGGEVNTPPAFGERKTTKLRPGESVEVSAIFGMAFPLNKPPVSMVGMESFMYRPITASLGLKVWSIRAISCL